MPPPPEPYHHLVEQYSGKRNSDANTTPKQGPSSNTALEKEDVPDLDNANGDSGSDSASSESSSSEEEDDNELDDEMERLLRENSEASSSSEGEDELQPSVASAPAGSKRRKGKDVNRLYESPAANISVLMVACWTMRVPVMYMDFIK